MTDKDCPVPEPFSGAIGSILFLTLLFFLTFIGRFIFAPLMPAMSSELGMSHSQAGSVFLSASLGVFIGSLSAGFVASRIQHKGTIALSLIGTASFLLLCTMLTSLWALRGAVLMLGLVSGFWLKVVVFLQPALIVCYFPPGFAALARIVQPNLRSLATAWVTPCAIVLGGGLFPLLLGYMGQAVTFASGIVLAGGIIIVGSGLPFLLDLIEKMDDGC